MIDQVLLFAFLASALLGACLMLVLQHPMRVALRYVADGPELVAEFMATASGAFTYRRIGRASCRERV